MSRGYYSNPMSQDQLEVAIVKLLKTDPKKEWSVVEIKKALYPEGTYREFPFLVQAALDGDVLDALRKLSDAGKVTRINHKFRSS